MKCFFESIDEIQRFTQQLGLQTSIRCPHCGKCRQLISHGFIYRFQDGLSVAIGKRLFCSNRFGRTGCGRTVQLYLADHIPKLHFGAAGVFTFISALFVASSIQKAYEAATKTADPRNAYRWIKRLWERIALFREIVLRFQKKSDAQFKNRTRRFELLLPIFKSLFDQLGAQPIAKYQMLLQKNFF